MTDAPGAEVSMYPQTLVEVRVDPNRRAPYIARQIVRSLITGSPKLRAWDASALANEAVSLYLDSSEPVLLTLQEKGRVVEIEVAGHPRKPMTDIARTLFERLASSWDSDDESTRFEIELVRRRSLEHLTDDELFALLPHDRDTRDQLYDRYEAFAASLAWRFRKRRDHQEDVIQVALGALVDAIERFDPNYGSAFTTYAGQTITGTLKRYLRDFTWSVKVPRALSDAAVHFNKERGVLAQRLGRLPTHEELAQATSATVEEVEAALAAGRVAYRAESLDAPLSSDGDDGGLLTTLGEEDDALNFANMWESVLPSIETLSETEQQVLHMRFVKEMTQSQIAEVVGVSQMQVSRLISKSINTLRGRVGA